MIQSNQRRGKGKETRTVHPTFSYTTSSPSLASSSLFPIRGRGSEQQYLLHTEREYMPQTLIQKLTLLQITHSPAHTNAHTQFIHKYMIKLVQIGENTRAKECMNVQTPQTEPRLLMIAMHTPIDETCLCVDPLTPTQTILTRRPVRENAQQTASSMNTQKLRTWQALSYWLRTPMRA